MFPVRLALQWVGGSRRPDTDSIPRALRVKLPNALEFRGRGSDSARHESAAPIAHALTGLQKRRIRHRSVRDGTY